MKRIVRVFLIAIVIVITYTCAWSQPGQPMERIHAAKMAYITDRLRLSEEQAGNFVPLYNEYDNEIRATRHNYFSKYGGVNPAESDDATALQAIDDNLDYQADVIDIKRKYNERFLKIITPQQLADLNRSEREFKQILVQRLKQHQNNGGRLQRRNGR